jgi:NADH:ubiquinone oxidoreductase subunit E
MSWNLDEALSYYKKQGAPGDQSASIALLKEIQAEYGHIPAGLLPTLAEALSTKDGYFLALIRRIPSLRLGEGHLLEVCAGPNCGKHAHLLKLAEELAKGRTDVTVKTIPCQRLCGKGPNIRFDGQLHHKADEALIRKLLTP